MSVYKNNGYNHKKNPNKVFKKYMDVYYNGQLCNIFLYLIDVLGFF